jgi:hypothetical protein
METVVSEKFSLKFVVHFALMCLLLANWILLYRTKVFIYNVDFLNNEVNLGCLEIVVWCIRKLICAPYQWENLFAVICIGFWLGSLN